MARIMTSASEAIYRIYSMTIIVKYTNDSLYDHLFLLAIMTWHLTKL